MVIKMNKKEDISDIPVVILCGGMGSRLSEETVERPKPMVEIGNRPILYHIMERYADYGFKKFILALGYKAEYIKNYFNNLRISVNDFTLNLDPSKDIIFHNNTHKDWEITFVDTGLSTLKGGRIKRISKFIKTPYFFLTYGDGVADIDISKLLSFHLSHGKIATLTAVRPISRFGMIELSSNTVTNFTEKPQLDFGYINGGFFVCNKEIMGFLTEDESCDLEFGALQELAKKGELMAFKHDGFWQCMDTLREKNYLESIWNSGNVPWKVK